MQGQYSTPGGSPWNPLGNSQQDSTPPTTVNSADEQAATFQTGAAYQHADQTRVENQLQASSRQIVPRPPLLAPPADVYHSQVANRLRASSRQTLSRPPDLAPSAGLYRSQGASRPRASARQFVPRPPGLAPSAGQYRSQGTNQVHASAQQTLAQPPVPAPPPDLYQSQAVYQPHPPAQQIPPGLQIQTQPQAPYQPQASHQALASYHAQASYDAQASYRPHIPALTGLAQPQTQTANPGFDRGYQFAVTGVYIHDLHQQFNDVRERYGISGSEDKVGYVDFCDRIIRDKSKITPPEALGELKDSESRCHIGTISANNRYTDPNEKGKWVYLRYSMETTDNVQKNWQFETHFRMPVGRSAVTFLPTLDATAAKYIVLRHIDWWQKQAYMEYHTEQILCAARRRVLKNSDEDHVEAEDRVVLSELKLASQHFMQFEHYSDEDSAVLKLILRQDE